MGIRPLSTSKRHQFNKEKSTMDEMNNTHQAAGSTAGDGTLKPETQPGLLAKAFSCLPRPSEEPNSPPP
jgi:hypothetical protein